MAEDSSCDRPIDGEPNHLETRRVTDTSTHFLQDVTMQLLTLLEDLRDAASFKPGQLLVVGASSSEVVGKRIGTATSMEVGRKVVQVVFSFAQAHGLDVAFQCCEHLNRSLVVEERVATRRDLPVVYAIPVPGAGGAVASAAYFAMESPVLVSHIAADAGIDIGDTLIGMHLLHVAVPVRGRIREIGQAHVTLALSRPPLVGGMRAVYDVEEAKRRVESGTV